MRVEDEDIRRVQPPECLDRRRPGVAAGRPDDGHARAPACQRVLEHLPDQLHGEILERQRRPVEQLQQVMVRPQLHQRRARVVPEPGVGAGDHVGEITLGERPGHEGPHHPNGDVLVRQARECRDIRPRQDGHVLGHVQSAVPREAGQHRVREAQDGGFSTGGDVAHCRSFRRCGV